MALSPDEITQNYEMLVQAAKAGNLNEIKRILAIEDMKIHSGDRNNFAFKRAAGKGHLHIVQYMVNFLPVKNLIATEDNAALVGAAQNGHFGVVRFLLTFGAVREKLTTFENASLRLAALYKHQNVVLYLLSFSAIREYFEKQPNNMKPEQKLFIRSQLGIVNREFKNIKNTNVGVISDNTPLPNAVVELMLQYITEDELLPHIENTFREQIIQWDDLEKKMARTYVSNNESAFTEIAQSIFEGATFLASSAASSIYSYADAGASYLRSYFDDSYKLHSADEIRESRMKRFYGA